MPRLTCLILILLAGCSKQPAVEAPGHDLVVRGGSILDGSGSEGYVGDVVVDGDRIVYVGKSRGDTAKTVIDATGKAVAPGFINMLSWAVESLIVDGRVAERSCARASRSRFSAKAIPWGR